MQESFGSSGATKVGGGEDDGAVKAKATEGNLRWISLEKYGGSGMNTPSDKY